jgi:hypothetical protein
MKIIIKEVGNYSAVSFAGTYDVDDDDDREIRAPSSLVIGKRDDECGRVHKKTIRLKIIRS